MARSTAWAPVRASGPSLATPPVCQPARWPAPVDPVDQALSRRRAARGVECHSASRRAHHAPRRRPWERRHHGRGDGCRPTEQLAPALTVEVGDLCCRSLRLGLRSRPRRNPTAPRSSSCRRARAPGTGPGRPDAVRSDGCFYLAYRLRRPVGDGQRLRGRHRPVQRRGGARDDRCDREGPTSVPSRWSGRAWCSCPTAAGGSTSQGRRRAPSTGGSTPSTRRTRPRFSSSSRRRPTLPGDAVTAMKDPVVSWDGRQWHLWVCCHPLPDPAEADRMVTR